MIITDKTIQANIRDAKKHSTVKYKMYGIGQNLWFRVHTKTGNASWQYRIALKDTSKKSGYKFSYLNLGIYPTLTLQHARIKAMELKEQVKSGINPHQQRKQDARQYKTLGDVFTMWLDQAQIKPAYHKRMIYDYNKHISKLGNTLMVNLTPELVQATIINPILKDNHDAQAKIILSKIKQLATFAYKKMITATDQLARLSNDFYTVKPRQRTLDTKELIAFLEAMEALKLAPAPYAYIKLILLLGTRKMELAALKWSNYDRTAKTLKLVNTKNNMDLLIKLPDAAIKLLDKLPRATAYVFPSSKGATPHVSQTYANVQLKLICDKADIDGLTPHDLRRTFVTKLAELQYPHHIIDIAVNHKPAGVNAHYYTSAYLDERHAMLNEWASWLNSLTEL